MQNIGPLRAFALGTVGAVSRGAKDTWTKDYVDIYSDGKPIRFVLDSRLLDTERGIYSEFVRPSSSMRASLSDITDLTNRYKDSLDRGTNLYLDIPLNIAIDEDKRLYEALQSFQDSLLDKLLDSIKLGGSLTEYLSKHVRNEKNYANEFKFMFIKQNNERDNIKYIHLKVIKSTKSFDRKGNELERNLLTYKSYRTVPLVKIDNIRIPKSRISSPSLNVHLCIESQIVDECLAEESYFNILQEYL